MNSHMLRIKLLTFCLCLVTGCLAQNIVLGSISKEHPYKRTQWTAKQYQAWQEKYGEIRGINCPYPPCDAVTQEECIAKAASLGYNSLRWWPAGNSAEEYIQGVEQWAKMGERYGMTVAPVFSFPQRYFSRADQETAQAELEAFVRKVTAHFRGDDRVIMWDIWNEPDLNSTETISIMEWIAKMAQWMQEEGCSQPITSSIIWDSEYSTCISTEKTQNILARESTEAMMDIHNFHDYNCQDGLGEEVDAMVNRLKKISDRPMVCTECMGRTNGSGFARTLIPFAKHGIGFYTWGLGAGIANWEVYVGRSTFYNYEPMFHNALYSDMEPVDENEPAWVRDFHYQGDFGGIRTDAEYTEVWTPRRAWRWMQGTPVRAFYAGDIKEASSMLGSLSEGTSCNAIAVTIPYSGTVIPSSATKSAFETLLTTAQDSGIRVIPILLTDKDLEANPDNAARYAHSFVSSYYMDGRILGWCLLRKTDASIGTEELANIRNLFRRTRYAFPCQPMFASPLLTSTGVAPDSLSNDGINTLWQLSDLCSVGSTNVDEEVSKALFSQYHKPVLFIGEDSSGSMTDIPYSSLVKEECSKAKRWDNWLTWQWMYRTPTKGIYSSNIAIAISKMNSFAKNGTPYNAICVGLDYRTFSSNKESFYESMDSLMRLAEKTGFMVLPQLLTDTYINTETALLEDYVTDVLSRYAHNDRILAWDLYNKPNATNTDTSKGALLIDRLFAAARQVGASQPLFMTPSVSVSTFDSSFDPVEHLTHGMYEGWDKLTYGKGNVSMCYRIWCLSDVIGYGSSQTSPHVGWLTAIANKFGRPLICTEWKRPSTEAYTNTLNIFRNMHVSWFVNGSLTGDDVRTFHYDPVSTPHIHQ